MSSAWAKELYRQIQQSWLRALRKAASHQANAGPAGLRMLVVALFFWFVLCDVLLL